MSAREPQPDDVRAALEELLAWPEIARSPQLTKFLNHIVAAKLRGEEATIKAYSIAVDVFGRPPAFDPQTDPIVRVQARRLRGLLHKYYRQGIGSSVARITLPVGRYIPEFEIREPDPAQNEAPASGTAEPAPAPAVVAPPLLKGPDAPQLWRQALAAGGLFAVLGLLLFALQTFRDGPAERVVGDLPPLEPIVFVSDFTNDSGDGTLQPFAALLRDQVGSVVAQLEDAQVGYLERSLPLPPTENAFVLSGTLKRLDGKLRITAQLADGASGAMVWNRDFDMPAPASEGGAAANAAARSIMRELTPFRGPLHAPARKWLDDHSHIAGVNNYLCLMTYRFARELLTTASMAPALDCLERLLKVEPDLPLAIAAKAWLEGWIVYYGAAPTDRLEQGLARPLELAQRARALAPESSFAYEQLGAVQNWMGQHGEAKQQFAIALGFVPLNTDARANYAVSLARSGDWAGAKQQAEMALADTPFDPPWYHYLPALIALREGLLAKAIEDGRAASKGSAGEIGAVVALAAAGHSHDSAVIAEMQPLVMSMEALRRGGIMPWLAIRIGDSQLLTSIQDGLRASGIPQTALTAQF